MSIPHYSVSITDNELEEGPFEIIENIRPQWQRENMTYKLLTDGRTNKLVACCPHGASIEETILIRVYGHRTDLVIDRTAEISNLIHMNRLRFRPKLYATFDNGLAYEYIVGCPLTVATIRLPNVYSLVAREMARIHRIPCRGEGLRTVVRNPAPLIWNKFDKFLSLIPDQFSNAVKQQRFLNELPAMSQIIEEVAEMKMILSELNSPVVFSHNDLLIDNIIYLESDEKVTFIDYEYAFPNYQAFDIGNHFAEFPGIENIDYSNYPNETLQRDWIRAYLDEYYRGEYTEDDITLFYRLANKFCLLSHLFWGLWALIQAEHSKIDVDYMSYANIRFQEYYRRKPEFLAL